MYENNTFETILSSMLNYVNEKNPDLDTREGSIIYTALAPIALELETTYREMDMVNDETFLATASKEYLVKHGDQIGLDLKEATHAQFEGEFDVDVEISARFSLNTFTYNVTEKISDPTEDNPYYRFEVLCETAGSEPNNYLGDLVPITYVPNLSHAVLTKVRIHGEDEEETEGYRYRLQTHVKKPPVNGNVAQYEEWLENYPEGGIGKYKVIPCWQGANTVKLLILNSNNATADETFVQEVQEYFDPIATQGMGDGVAPIGAVVTVETAEEVPVTVMCSVTLKEGYTTNVGVQEAIENYFSSIALEQTKVEYMPIFAEIYKAESVSEVTSLLVVVNGEGMDKDLSPFIDSVDIGEGKIPVLNTATGDWSV